MRQDATFGGEASVLRNARGKVFSRDGLSLAGGPRERPGHGCPPDDPWGFRRALEALGWMPARLVVASGFISRLLGIASPALWHMRGAFVVGFPRCRAVHTLHVRRRIDVAFIDAPGTIVEVHEGVMPGRMLACSEATSVIERWSPMPGRAGGYRESSEAPRCSCMPSTRAYTSRRRRE